VPDLAAVARRTGWGVADQALSSLTNFALGILVARTVSTAELGAFALAFATYAIWLNVSRALAAQPLVVRFSGVAEQTWHEATAASQGVCLWVGLAGAATCGLIAAVSEGPVRAAFLALAIGLPGLLVQDGWRYAFFAAGRGRDAFVNDGVWTVVMVPLIVAAGMTASLFWLTLAWGAAATTAGAVGIIQSRVVPRLAAVRPWWREQRSLGARFLAESMTGVLSTQAVLYLLGAIAGLAAVGALRAGQLILGPSNILIQGVQLVAVPEAVGALRRGVRQLTQFVVAVGAVLATLVGLFGLVVVGLPDAIGSAVLGENWLQAQPVLVPVAIGNVAVALTAATFVGLRALAAATRSLRASVVGAVLTVVLGTFGAWNGGAVGAAWGLSAAVMLGFGAWLIEYWRGSLEVAERSRIAR
jgi:O-antigen/teichoic acid export membrane protein